LGRKSTGRYASPCKKQAARAHGSMRQRIGIPGRLGTENRAKTPRLADDAAVFEARNLSAWSEQLKMRCQAGADLTTHLFLLRIRCSHH